MEKRTEIFIAELESRGIKLGLERVQELAALLGNPEKKLKCIHVAGTNGKGSVIAFLSSALRAAGFKVGIYTSPHLTRLNERFQINGQEISGQQLEELILELKEKFSETEIQPTYFEFFTLLAFEFFVRQKVDFALMETGLGGRLDATNIVQPLVSVVTNVELEHTKFLGQTIQEIAGEKAGIIKENNVLITAEEKPEVLKVLEEKCREKNAELIKAQDFPWNNFELGLRGRHQIKNALTALACLQVLEQDGFKVTEKNSRQGLKQAFIPARFETVQETPQVILDAAHNPAGVQALAKTLQEVFPGQKIVFVFGVSSDKDIKKMLSVLKPLAAKFIFCRAALERALPVEEIEKIAGTLNIQNFEVKENVSEAVSLALENVSQGEIICVTGSLFVCGEARQLWQARTGKSVSPSLNRGKMRIAIINCDLDESRQTNSAVLLNNLIPDSTVIDYCKGERIDGLDEFDGFVISGSRAHITDGFPWIGEVVKAVKEIRNLQKPCLAVCFGMGLVASVFGGLVQVSKVNETGFKKVQLEASSQLFSKLPSALKVYELYQDITSKIPEGARAVAKNEVCVQAFVFENFYCLQFHPEITSETALTIAKRDGDDINAILNGVGMEYNTPTKIISNFVSIVLNRQKENQ